MKITVKEVNGTKFELDGVTAQTNVQELKAMIEKVKGWAPSTQKLVFSGKILADDKSLADYEWKDKEGAFLVCMISKKAPAAASAAPVAAAAASATPVAPKPVSAPSAPAKASPSASGAAAASPSPAAAAPAASPSLVKESDVAALKEMGFPEDQVRHALAAAFGNTDRAVEYLMNGIPAQAAPRPAAPAPAAAAPAAGGGSQSDFPQLRGNPSILNQLKQVSTTNPQALAGYIQQLKNTHPAIIEEINRNRAGFLALLREPVVGGEGGMDEVDEGGEGEGGDDDDGMDIEAGSAEMMSRFVQEFQSMSQEQRAQAAAAMGVPPQEMAALVQMMSDLPPEALAQLAQQVHGGGGLGGGGGRGGAHPGQTVIHLTQQEMDALTRLQELGFTRQQCLEAYLACDKNEDLAADLLFRNPPQDD